MHALPKTPERAAAKRLESVDALRGFDMFWIVGGRELLLATIALFVSPVPASVEYQLEHVPWESFSFSAWDLIMPLFLFVSGVALPFSLSKWSGSNESRKGLYLRLARRILILWVLGIAVQGNLLDWNLDKLKLYSNTLQAIAAGYLIATIFLLTMSVRVQVAATAALLLGYWALLMWVPVPGAGPDPLDPWTNLTKYVDKAVLGRFADTWMYTWIVPSLGFGATVMFGAFAGHILRSGVPETKKFQRLLGVGVACLALGWIWSYWFPFIKYIWSSSMNLWAGGWCFLLLAIFYWVIDIRGYRKWAFPLVVIGTNAIAVYVATHLFDFSLISDVFVGELAPRLGAFGDFLRALGAFLVAWLILLYMYRKKTFIRI
jgi:predicted acyltransferase